MGWKMYLKVIFSLCLAPLIIYDGVKWQSKRAFWGLCEQNSDQPVKLDKLLRLKGRKVYLKAIFLIDFSLIIKDSEW